MCCGPCSIYPLSRLIDNRIDITGFFHNPNIHPYREFERRIESTLQVAGRFDVPVEVDREYGLTDYLQRVVFHEQNRCSICYDMRLEQTARTAVTSGFDGFSTTLLYSRYQDHMALKNQAEKWGEKYGVPFFYADFREGWQYGIDQSIEYGVYRQPYCGCIYSEQERYDNRFKKKQKKHLNQN